MSAEGFVEITATLRIPLSELTYRASRSSGPGGQHVNTSSTRIEVVWDIAASAAVTEEERARLLARLATRLDSAGRLRLVSGETRSQLRNRESVTERLRTVVASALALPKRRKRTRVPASVKAARLEAKRRRSDLKRTRRRPENE
ncbi:MAG TPA: alternative ribosome rescue aminoacyl-tRNA hydrolase ArfB [Gemmatimonadales bacterium]|jgi:ribosome-associated protein|nr:alternative ribosome rescue aminoacyl-tRNA hydrolase ArfB [Gemmatimonadales bacterium]